MPNRDGLLPPVGRPRPVALTEASYDAFGRIRVSDPVTLFDSQQQYGLDSVQWETRAASSNSSVTALPNEASARLEVASTSAVYTQSRQYWPYQPGKSLLVLTTGIFGPKQSAVTKRMGYYDGENGIFLQQSTSGPAWVKRSYVTGTATDTAVAQANWNLDPMDGTGPSGIVYRSSLATISVIDLEWLGLGRVRCGLNIDGATHYCHQFCHANASTSTYMTRASLPVRYEIACTSTASTGSMKQVCASVQSEGGFTDFGQTFTVSNSTGTVISTALTSVLSIRPSTAFGGLTNRTFARIEEIDVQAAGNPVEWQLVWNTAHSSAATWAAVSSAYSGMEYSVSTASTGGVAVQSGSVPSNASARASRSASPRSPMPLTVDSTGGNPVGMTVMARGLTGTPTVFAALTWRETR